MEINYIGEHLLPGQLGELFIAIAFISALFAAVGYAIATNKNDDSWAHIARWSFRIHALAVIGIAATLFHLIFNHYFEYNYAYQHSSTALPLRYIFSCFWEGQEGSFLLWMFWHAVLGNVLIYTAKKWESPVMSFFSITQVFLSSMLLGVYVFGLKIGSNPFMLLRENPDFLHLPFIQNPNYLRGIEGTGLNPLLQNYWMTIHPPTLFLGFASTLIPFAYAMAALWKRDLKGWLTPVLPWTYFGIAILGTGILMGGAWAYEALSFGGFWAWDPVENASLVPWLTLVAAGHLMLLNKTKPQSLFLTFFISILTFLLILYSTYLTRSGVLGETSVHSFAAGQPTQLVVFLLFFSIGALAWLFSKIKLFPKQKEEERIWSREFWMFIGALVLCMAAFQITFTTSIPVINKLFNTNMAPPIDAIDHYNSWQLPLSVLLALLIGFTQFFKYKQTDMRSYLKQISLSFVSSVVLTVVIAYVLEITIVFHLLLLFGSLFATLANTHYFFRMQKRKIGKSGAAIAHVGVGLMLLGILISTGKKEIISANTSGIEINMRGEENANKENIMLPIYDTLPMGGYHLTYQGKRREGHHIYYQVDYLKWNYDGSYTYLFTLEPFIQLNKLMGNVPEPDTRHFWNKDIFTHITYAEITEDEEEALYEQADTFQVALHDSIFASNAIVTLEEISTNVDLPELELQDDDLVIKATLRATDASNNTHFSNPLMIIRNNQVYTVNDSISALGLDFNLVKISPETGKVSVTMAEKKDNGKDFIIMQAMIFPYINVLWIGCFIMIIGSFIAIYARVSLSRKPAQ
jgi:cytochrome c-type biogenesis protein CcmF